MNYMMFAIQYTKDDGLGQLRWGITEEGMIQMVSFNLFMLTFILQITLLS